MKPIILPLKFKINYDNHGGLYLGRTVLLKFFSRSNWSRKIDKLYLYMMTGKVVDVFVKECQCNSRDDIKDIVIGVAYLRRNLLIQINGEQGPVQITVPAPDWVIDYIAHLILVGQ